MFMTALTLPPLTDRFSLSIDGLWRAVAAMIAGGRTQAAMFMLIVTRIRRIETRVLALVAAIRAGRVRGGWVVEARAMRLRALAPPPASLKLPRRFAWLCVLVPYHAAGYASQLRHLLADPEMVALLAATPRLGKILRPLCQMLGIEAELLSPQQPLPISDVVTVIVEDDSQDPAAKGNASEQGLVVARAPPTLGPGGGVVSGLWLYKLG